jgi:hypothetical protein
VGFSLTPLGIRSFAAVFAAPGEVAAEAEESLRVVFINLPQARCLLFYTKKVISNFIGAVNYLILKVKLIIFSKLS